MVLQGKVALITGASRGIGRAMALGMAREGADLILAARNLEPVEDLAHQIEGMGRQALAVRADVSSEEQVRRMVETGMDRFGRLDILHNNAAVLHYHELVSHPLDQWNETLAINITGTWLCCRAALPIMARQNYGRVINMTSILSALCVPSYGSYNVSKAAVNALTRTLAKEFRNYDILINGQHPGNIHTDMNPAGSHPVDHAVPTAIYLASLPSGGPTGKFYYNMKEMPEIS